jgi:hypothetical protein
MTGPKLCYGQHQNVSEHLQPHLGGENGREMKKEAGSTFVLPAIIRTLCLFNIIPAVLASGILQALEANYKQSSCTFLVHFLFVLLMRI